MYVCVDDPVFSFPYQPLFNPSSYSITCSLQQLDIAFDFDVSFDKAGDESDIDTATFAATQDSEALAATDIANVDDYITAFKCTGLGTVENTADLANDDILQVCIKSSLGATVAIQRIKTLDLTQTGGGTFSVMDGSGGLQNPNLSDITNGASETVVETIVPARFFDTSNTIEVSGVVEVDFDRRRRLVAFGNNRLGSNDRKMIEAPFEDAELPQETDAKFNFDVTPIEKASTEEDQFVDMNSGSTIGAAAGALAAVAVSYLW